MTRNSSFIKRQKTAKKRLKKLEKEERKIQRQKNSKSGELEDMLAYVDEFGNLSSEPPAKKSKAAE